MLKMWLLDKYNKVIHFLKRALKLGIFILHTSLSYNKNVMLCFKMGPSKHIRYKFTTNDAMTSADNYMSMHITDYMLCSYHGALRRHCHCKSNRDLSKDHLVYAYRW